MIKEYYLKDGTKRYKFKAYLGTDPLTGKKRVYHAQTLKLKKRQN
ncbi:hypothetical protein ACF3NG_10135 [Aerococcaceae bacterium WGS1372]